MSMAALRWARTVRGITSTQKFVLVMLADQANDYGEAWPSALLLAADCCLSDRAVRDAMDALEERGLISGDRQTGRATRWCIHVGRTPEPASEPPASASVTPERGSALPAVSGTALHPGTTFRPTPEAGSDPPRNVVPVTPERGSDRTLKNPHTTPIKPSERATRRASRLPADWMPDLDQQQFARSLDLDPAKVGAKFRDYWTAKGANAAKLDWSATWRNWCRTEAERNPSQRSGSPQQSKLGWMLRQ